MIASGLAILLFANSLAAVSQLACNIREGIFDSKDVAELMKSYGETDSIQSWHQTAKLAPPNSDANALYVESYMAPTKTSAHVCETTSRRVKFSVRCDPDADHCTVLRKVAPQIQRKEIFFSESGQCDSFSKSSLIDAVNIKGVDDLESAYGAISVAARRITEKGSKSSKDRDHLMSFFERAPFDHVSSIRSTSEKFVVTYLYQPDIGGLQLEIGKDGEICEVRPLRTAD